MSLNEILKIAKTEIPYYIDDKCDCEDFLKFPIVSRKTISGKKDDFISKKITAYDLKYMKCLRTSGTSTGFPLEVYWSKEDYIRSSYVTWKYRRMWYDIYPTDKYVSFHTYSYANNRAKPLEDTISDKNNLSLCAFDLTDEKIKKYCTLIEEYKPKWIQFIPSVALKFIEYMKKNLIAPFSTIEYIEYNGETLNDSVRTEIDRFFNVKSANLYGSMELNSIAYECPHGKMQILTENVYAEFIDGKIYVTSLMNKIMPIIRYDLGDKVKIENNTCNCTDNKVVISKIFGRSNSCIQISDKTISEGEVGYYIDLVNNELCNCIKQFCFVIKDSNYVLTLYIHKKFNGWKENITNKIVEIFKNNQIELCADYIVYTNQIIDNKDKKFKIFRK